MTTPTHARRATPPLPAVRAPAISARGLLVSALLLGLVSAPGCVASKAPSNTALRPTDFVDPAAPAVPPPARPSERTITRTGPIAASETIIDLEARPGDPNLPVQSVPIAEAAFIDAKIGDVNNRPVYVSDFLGPLEDRLRTEAAKRPRAEWIQMARKDIRERLVTFVEDELLRAEALNRLTPDQRSGVMTFMRQLQTAEVSKSGGNRTAADERIREKTGQSFDEYMESEKEKNLIQYELRGIFRKINVSWHDIELAYEKNYELFNPNPTAFLGIIRVSKDDTGDVQLINEAFGAGKDFDEVASLEQNRYLPEKAGLNAKEFTGTFETSEFFAYEELNDAVRKLTPGAKAGPIEAGGSVWWIKLHRIEQKSMGLYDAQLGISEGITKSRQNEARQKYIRKLQERASVSDIDEMTDALLAVAVERYLDTKTR
ncbi:MAG: hypothetical protein IT434_00070 [Phycisphaerales bacterium]|jgi:hypothetical protein|nr:hypothetical protein [Phycisphaerales bacterium]